MGWSSKLLISVSQSTQGCGFGDIPLSIPLFKRSAKRSHSIDLYAKMGIETGFLVELDNACFKTSLATECYQMMIFTFTFRIFISNELAASMAKTVGLAMETKVTS